MSWLTDLIVNAPILIKEVPVTFLTIVAILGYYFTNALMLEESVRNYHNLSIPKATLVLLGQNSIALIAAVSVAFVLELFIL